MPSPSRGSWIDVDLGAIRRNVARLVAVAQPAALLAAVKGDGYGHGSIEVGRAALEAGAVALGVATPDEGRELRAAGIASPILVLSEVGEAGAALIADHGLEAVVTDAAAVSRLESAAESPVRVHLKIDTGMHRVGCDPGDAVELAATVRSCRATELAGVMTHLAVADEPDNGFTDTQLDRFDEVLAALSDADVAPGVVHAANSAATLAVRRARYDLVRVGIAIYGLAPSPALEGRVALEPALSLRSVVSSVRRVGAGESASYGRRWLAPADTVLATIPLGYADGVPRSLGLSGGSVLIGGSRRPIVGPVTMDQLMVDVGDAGGATVSPGDEVVVIGRQSGDEISAWDIALLEGTIAYEIVVRLGARLPRRHRG